MKSFVNEISTSFCEVKPFEFVINYAELDKDSPDNIHESHFHDRCEIYINISGDVSYMVENHLYPVSKGDIIITKPFEYHNCIYNNSNTWHKQYCLGFKIDGNEDLFEFISNIKSGEDNLIKLTSDDFEKIIDCCNILLEKKLNNIQKYAYFTKICAILSKSKSNERTDIMPEIIKNAVDYVNKNISAQFTVEQLALVSHVSVNTLERHFKEVLGTSPAVFIRDKKLANAAHLLRRGASVTDACFDSGFVNCSHFIVQFKKRFGITPNKYRTKSE